MTPHKMADERNIIGKIKHVITQHPETTAGVLIIGGTILVGGNLAQEIATDTASSDSQGKNLQTSTETLGNLDSMTKDLQEAIDQFKTEYLAKKTAPLAEKLKHLNLQVTTIKQPVQIQVADRSGRYYIYEFPDTKYGDIVFERNLQNGQGSLKSLNYLEFIPGDARNFIFIPQFNQEQPDIWFFFATAQGYKFAPVYLKGNWYVVLRDQLGRQINPKKLFEEATLPVKIPVVAAIKL